MKKITVYSNKYPMNREYFSRVFEILEYSFPKSERRGYEEHLSEFQRPAFRSMVLDDGAILGFMNFWELEGFLYLEHFAIAKKNAWKRPWNAPDGRTEKDSGRPAHNT